MFTISIAIMSLGNKRRMQIEDETGNFTKICSLQLASMAGDALPMEVLVEIFSLLPTSSDVLECGLVCRNWWRASTRVSSLLHNKTRVTLVGDDGDSSTISLLAHGALNGQEGPPVFSHFHVEHVSLSASPDWLSIAARLTNLTLVNSMVAEKDLIRILARCVHLKSLGLIDMSQVFISGCFLSSPDDRATVQPALENLRDLNLAANQYMSDALFNQVPPFTSNRHSGTFHTI